MEEIPRISDAEWEVMKILWETSPLSANDIIDTLRVKVTWKPKTVKTLLNRLLKKGAVHYEKSERAYLYFPRVSKEECSRRESDSFLDRVYDGEFNLLFAGFLKSKPLSKADIEELKRLLDETGKP